MTLRYFGDSPYCTANSLSVIFGDAGPGAATIEICTGSPFGLAIHETEAVEDDIIFFASPKWNPEFGINHTLETLGWEYDRTFGDAEASLNVLRNATWDKPVLVGPLEMGLLPYFPGLGVAVGADHSLVVLGVEGDLVRAHDVIGWPFVTIPIEDLLKAWEGNTFAYPADAYAVRHNFRQARKVTQAEAIRASMRTAVDMLDTPAIAEAAERAATLIENGLSNMQYKYLVEFQIKAGARRLADAGALYRDAGATTAADILDQQALLVGSLQLDIMKHEDARAAATFRKLAPTYGQLREALGKEL